MDFVYHVTEPINMEDLSHLLTDTCRKIKEDKRWTSVSKIIGEAVEDCVSTMACPLCHEKTLIKYKMNEKSKDMTCETCHCHIQVKATKSSKKKTHSLKLLGAEYKTTSASIKKNDVHYLIVSYSVLQEIYTIHNIYFIDRADVTECCIIPRKPLSSSAKRAGWQGCMLVFNTYRSLY